MSRQDQAAAMTVKMSGLPLTTKSTPATIAELQNLAARPYQARHPGAPFPALQQQTCTCQGVGEAVVPMPQSDYAAQIIHTLWEKHGVRSIAVSRNWRDRLVLEHRYPTLASHAVAASYVLGRRSVADLAHTLQRRHHVVAVVPHHEQALLPMVELASALGLPWAQPDVIPLFRDKAALKAALRRQDPSLRLTRSARVESVDEIAELVRYWSLDRYVVKPNDGSGNSRVGFFRRRSSMQRLADHLRDIDGPAVLEEYVDGDEFYIDGQMDHRGEPLIVAVHEYEQVTVQAKPNVCAGAFSLAEDDVRYHILAEYARKVMRASGLRRSPFHMEVRLDGRGPSLIEVGARFVGMGSAMLDSLVSGVDVFEMAAHYYLHDRAYQGMPQRRPRRPLNAASVLGINDAELEVSGVEGISAAEQIPGFLAWTRTPRRSGQVPATVDLESTAWAALLVAGEADTLRQSAAELRRTMTWNATAPGPLQRVGDLGRRVWSARPRVTLLRTRPIHRAPQGSGPATSELQETA